MHIQSRASSRLLNSLAGFAAVAAAASVSAADMGGVAIHGSLSVTSSYSPDYNYLGDTKENLDINQTELILNGTKRFDNGIKAAAQIYAYELAGYEDLSLDFANLDYSFRPEIGLRVGRNKLPLGLYTEVQDLDQVRIFASLPLNFYPKALRAFGSFYDGAALYGNVGMGKAGGVDYQVYAGYGVKVDEDHPFMKGIGASALEGNKIAGLSVFWNTPVAGLRAGYGLEILPQGDLVLVPGLASDLEYQSQVFSVEYTKDKWTLAAEYKISTVELDFALPFIPTSQTTDDIVYGQVTYQATDRIGLGVYHCHADFDNGDTVDDTAFAISYAIQPWWLVKAEAHAIDGLHSLGDSGDVNPGATDETWTYFVLKTTLSF